MHDKELAEIAVDSFWAYWGKDSLWSTYHPQSKDAWRAAVCSVLEEAIYRVEAKICAKRSGPGLKNLHQSAYPRTM